MQGERKSLRAHILAPGYIVLIPMTDCLVILPIIVLCSFSYENYLYISETGAEKWQLLLS